MSILSHYSESFPCYNMKIFDLCADFHFVSRLFYTKIYLSWRNVLIYEKLACIKIYMSEGKNILISGENIDIFKLC